MAVPLPGGELYLHDLLPDLLRRHPGGQPAQHVVLLLGQERPGAVQQLLGVDLPGQGEHRVVDAQPAQVCVRDGGEQRPARLGFRLGPSQPVTEAFQCHVVADLDALRGGVDGGAVRPGPGDRVVVGQDAQQQEAGAGLRGEDHAAVELVDPQRLQPRVDAVVELLQMPARGGGVLELVQSFGDPLLDVSLQPGELLDEVAVEAKCRHARPFRGSEPTRTAPGAARRRRARKVADQGARPWTNLRTRQGRCRRWGLQRWARPQGPRPKRSAGDADDLDLGVHRPQPAGGLQQ
ncbi:hypothetical protein [Streptacidiphilus fuscans]|uniref:Uncharacterized protein n=1 Tax=Streptacidiphilus fuscans TaxID=2789292 RepID=A0A931FIY9_9ACTN|nr:hypothetical protein [Streptacidiphilus fuscans]MBF9072244.1 hypothetical protein [Streptacidiphilus fuscans]